MTNNAEYTDEYLAEIARLGGDADGRRAARDYMEHSTAIYHHEVVDSAYVPRLYDKATRERMRHIAETTHSALCKVMREYLDNPAYRDVYDLDERMRELVLLPRGYDALLPFSRFDIFLDEDTLGAGFCEFNADGSSGMNEDREISASIANSVPFSAFAKKHSVRTSESELFDGWVDEFLRVYATYEHRAEHPHVAIVDFLENSVTDEFKVFAALFAKHGVECSVYDMRELRFEGGRLMGGHAFFGRDDAPIDAVWRRCVTNDVADHWDESQALIEAVRAHAVALIGSFAGHLVHDKQVFRVLRDPRTRALLSDEENALMEELVPTTAFLEDGAVDIAEVKANREQWIIKPTDAYGAQDVFAGREFESDEEWARVVDAHANGAAGAPFLAQRYITPFKTLTLPLYGEEADYTRDAVPFNNLTGLYVYNGRFVGAFSRLGPNPVICKRTHGITAASVWVED